MDDNATPGADSDKVVGSAVAGAVADLSADDDGVAAPEETASQRFSNYCKGIGALVGGATAVIAAVLSVIALTRTPGEPTAKKGYAAIDGVVKQLSTDLQKEHDGRAYADALLAKDVSAMHDQLQLVVQLLSTRSGSRPVRPVRVPAFSKAGDLLLSPPSTPTSQPAVILQQLEDQTQARPATKALKVSPRPPLRSLPKL